MNKYTCLLILAISLSFCDTKKITTQDFSIPPKNSKELISRVNSKNNHPQWLSLNAVGKIINKDEVFSINLSIKTRKDSVIWISGTAFFGIELFRAQLTLDSVYFLNRTNKTYLVQPGGYLNKVLNRDLSFYDLQDVITANPKILKNNYQLEENQIRFYLFSDSCSYSITNNYRVQNVKLRDSSSSFECSFNDYKEADNFPRKVVLKIEGDEIFEISLNYSKVEFNKPQKILFEIPSSYHEIK